MCRHGDDVAHRAEAIVLHDVARHLAELSQVPLPPVDSDVAHLVIIVPIKQRKTNDIT